MSSGLRLRAEASSPGSLRRPGGPCATWLRRRERVVPLFRCFAVSLSPTVAGWPRSGERGSVPGRDDRLLHGVGDLDVAGDQLAAAAHGDVHRAGGGALEVADAAAGLAYQQ